MFVFLNSEMNSALDWMVRLNGSVHCFEICFHTVSLRTLSFQFCFQTQPHVQVALLLFICCAMKWYNCSIAVSLVCHFNDRILRHIHEWQMNLMDYCCMGQRIIFASDIRYAEICHGGLLFSVIDIGCRMKSPTNAIRRHDKRIVEP